MDEPKRTVYLISALTGMLVGALSEAFGEMTKELRRNTGSNFDNKFDALKAGAMKTIENAALDGIAETDQLLLIEQTRHIVGAILEQARSQR